MCLLVRKQALNQVLDGTKRKRLIISPFSYTDITVYHRFLKLLHAVNVNVNVKTRPRLFVDERECFREAECGFRKRERSEV